MQVAVGALHQDLEVGQALQAISDRGRSRGELAAVGDDGVVASEALGLVGHIGFQVGPADLFLAFDHELDVDRQLAGGLEPRLGGFQMREHLALIVGGAAGVEVAVALGRLERGREPRLERFGGLDVVMPVDEQRRLARCGQPFGVDDRVALGFDQLGLEPHRGQVVAHPDGGPARVGVMIGLGADAGNPDQGLELLFEIASMGLQIGLHAQPYPSPSASRAWDLRECSRPPGAAGPSRGENQYNIAGAPGDGSRSASQQGEDRVTLSGRCRLDDASDDDCTTARVDC